MNQYHFQLEHMATNLILIYMETYIVIYQFQVVFMTLSGQNQYEIFQEQVLKSMSSDFTVDILKYFERTCLGKMPYMVSLLMFY